MLLPSLPRAAGAGGGPLRVAAETSAPQPSAGSALSGCCSAAGAGSRLRPAPFRLRQGFSGARGAIGPRKVTAAAAGPFRKPAPSSPPTPGSPAPLGRRRPPAAAPAAAAAGRFGIRGTGGARGGGGGSGAAARGPAPPSASPEPGPMSAREASGYSTGAFGIGAADEELALVSFHIPVASPTTDPEDVVRVPHIRDLLVPRDSPLLAHDNFGGGFVDDEDRVALNTMSLAGITSAGATDMCVDLHDSGILLGGAATGSRSPPASGAGSGTGKDGKGGGRGDGGRGRKAGGATAGTAAGASRWPITTGSPASEPRHTHAHGITRMDEAAGGGAHNQGGEGQAEGQEEEVTIGRFTAFASRVPAELAAAAAAEAAATAAAVAAGGGSAGSEGWGFGEGDGGVPPPGVPTQLHNVSAVADRVCVSLPPWALRAGPRRVIWFEPARVNAAVVACGHICPGINDGVVHRLTDYGVPEGQVLGIPDGFAGFSARHPAKPRPLTRAVTDGAHLRGGCLLGTSKGWADIEGVVKKIEMWEINMLFVVGGDGGLRAAQLISEACRARNLPCCCVGVPKSIENDILLMDRTFGFETAVQELQRPLLAAKIEASSTRGCIGLVKVTGRHSGFLAMQASIASGVVDVCLIPEVSFTMDGPHGLLAYLGAVIDRKGHAVVCVAEGAGQDLISAAQGAPAKDALGNPVLHDIGVYLRTRMRLFFRDRVEVRYMDPTYLVRTPPCTALDHIYARVLAHNAVDAAFSAFTGVTVGMVNTHHVLLPVPLVTQAPRRVDPWGKAWNRLRADNGQPSFHPPSVLGRAASPSSSGASEGETTLSSADDALGGSGSRSGSLSSTASASMSSLSMADEDSAAAEMYGKEGSGAASVDPQALAEALAEAGAIAKPPSAAVERGADVSSSSAAAGRVDADVMVPAAAEPSGPLASNVGSAASPPAAAATAAATAAVPGAVETPPQVAAFWGPPSPPPASDLPWPSPPSTLPPAPPPPPAGNAAAAAEAAGGAISATDLTPAASLAAAAEASDADGGGSDDGGSGVDGGMAAVQGNIVPHERRKGGGSGGGSALGALGSALTKAAEGASAVVRGATGGGGGGGGSSGGGGEAEGKHGASAGGGARGGGGGGKRKGAGAQQGGSRVGGPDDGSSE
ncbi:hypothetical protein HYH03_016979 [Edaphochlamys debaryana]|uniref:Phosphofructokinase domain-containing protein n=1 Tax=Edaphochlamys debaryana TaxID=47281 RepID=A0A836BPK0_9CHLO|nr:hypothetical protein HYH03_016979 [Edaphochlamys debaryana]|eukprot:KAG2484165.1 hypothetical protein HYH03_016979 [Edaphochlamys debaryana]